MYQSMFLERHSEFYTSNHDEHLLLSHQITRKGINEWGNLA